MDTLLSAILLGFVLGVQHASDPDHLVAVATIVTRERRFADGARIGLLWGLGHMLTLTAAAAVIVGLNLTLSSAVTGGFELAVAGMLILLGVLRLRDTLSGLTPGVRHLTADHDHGAIEVLHRHRPLHREAGHAEFHLHPSRRLLAALGKPPATLARRAILVGAVHGLAGSAAVSLLIIATLHSAVSAAIYLGVFGLGTILGMTALTAAMAFPVALADRFAVARRLLAVSTGLGSIVFGLVYAARVL